jgi:hypothetical protein
MDQTTDFYIFGKPSKIAGIAGRQFFLPVAESQVYEFTNPQWKAIF